MMRTTTTTISVKIAAIALVAALTFITAAGIFAATLTQVQATKGEAAFHISNKGRANQSPQGASSSGVFICSACG